MAHLKGFGLENFRVFKEHTWFDFAPITLLIGPNSSGKSSLNKGLLLAKDSYLAGKLIFDKSEDIHQLGNFERVKNNNHTNQNISLSFPYELLHYPSLGATTPAKIIYTYSKDGFEDLSFEINNEVLFRLGNNIILFDFDVFNKFLVFNKNLTINEDTKIIEREILFAETKIYGNTATKFAIVDNSRKSKRQLKKIIDGVQSIGHFEDINFTEIYCDDNLDRLKSILELYKGTALPKGQKQEELTYEESSADEFGNYEWIDSFILEHPIDFLFRQNKVNDYLREFILKEILNISDKKYNIPQVESIDLINYIKPFRDTPKRIYRNEEENDLNKLLKEYRKNNSNNNSNFIKIWSSQFKLEGDINLIEDIKYNFNSIEIGASPLIEKGFGITQLSYLLLSISINEKRLLIIEEPEANLHPAFQSKLADMFYDAHKTFNQQFIIETHSEYMVRKFQYLVAKGEMKKEDIVIYYFHDPKENKSPTKIEILEDGSLSDDFGSGFYDEAANWELELLRLKKNKIRQN